MKIAIVIPWFGKDLNGGAEQVAFQMAKKMTLQGIEVEVLTTCCRSFFDPWDLNEHPPGLRQEDGVFVRRFAVLGRQKEQFDRVVRRLLSIRPDEMEIRGPILRSEDEDIYWEQQLRCPDLLEYVEKHQGEYDRFLILPYLFSLTTDVAQIVGAKSVVQPCLHDECYARLRRVQTLILDAGWLVFNSEGEKQLAKQRFGEWIEKKSSVVGLGVEWEETSVMKPVVEGRYVFYLGRRLREKGVADLVSAFQSFKESTSSDLQLVLAGPGEIDGAGIEGVLNLGQVSHEHKISLLQNCEVLVNPSPQESFSRVLYEAWFEKKPVVVNKDCLATHYAVLGSEGGGWSTDGSVSGFQKIFEFINSVQPSELVQAGLQGEKWAKKTAQWDGVIDRLLHVFQTPPPFQNQVVAIVYPDCDQQEKARFWRALRGTKHKIFETGHSDLDKNFDAKIFVTNETDSKRGWVLQSPQEIVGHVFDLFGDSALKCVQKKVTGEKTPRVMIVSDNEDFYHIVSKCFIDAFSAQDLRRRDPLFLLSLDLAVVDCMCQDDVSDLQAMGVPIVFSSENHEEDSQRRLNSWVVKTSQIPQAVSFILQDRESRERLVQSGYKKVEIASAGHWQSSLSEI
ncbi:MAG: glycosyltransferase family 4 protein [Oligoflexales bacterium]